MLPLLVLLIAGLFPAQTRFGSTVRLVLVPVSVLGPHGEPISGLRRDDFRLSVDGRNAPITAFDTVKAAPFVAGRARPIPPNEFLNIPYTAAAPATRTVLLIDDLNTTSTDRQRIRGELLRWLAARPPDGPPTAIYGLTDTLVLAAPFTLDRAMLSSVARRILARKAPIKTPGARPFEVVRASQAGPAAAEHQARDALSLAAPGDALEYFLARGDWITSNLSAYVRAKTTLAALHELAASLAGVPGRKVVLWLTGDIGALNPSLAMQASLSDPSLVPPRVREADVLDAYDALDDADAALCPVDLRGSINPALTPAADAMSHAEFRQAMGEDRLSGSGAEVAASGPGDLAASIAAGSQLAMTTAAVETGGAVFSGRNDLDRLLTAASRPWASYYVLATPYPAGSSTARHSVRVQLRQPRRGVRLLFRHGFGPVRPADGSPPAEWLVDSTAVPLLLRLGAEKHVANSWSLPFLITLPATLDHGSAFSVRIDVMTLDDRGHVLASSSRYADRALSAGGLQEARSHGFTLQGAFTVTGDGLRLGRVVVRDRISGQVGSITIALP
ncbi:MAG TPA: VWA domain-containing protein [Terriglobales bacterium]|nr:VWA domain-containing protein [Terriglobales bacterium]